MKRQRRPLNCPTLKQYLSSKRAITPIISRGVFARPIPDVMKYFYPHKPYRPRLSITLEDIAGILALTDDEARKVMREIDAMPGRSKYPFITVKDMAAFLKINQWRIQHYFYSCMIYEYYEMRQRHRKNK
ncbi:hypothetical protein [Longitalea luteola]|uniref:hypothetical protein n=1 Tax=Longitalea luteola TaxID=2812563 RepID=UPI001A969CA9|nr:hypothetical protein [Longitalea luteola]